MPIQLLEPINGENHHNSVCNYLNRLEKKICPNKKNLFIKVDLDTEYPLSIDINEELQYHLFNYDKSKMSYHFISAESVFFHCSKKRIGIEKHYSKAADLAYIYSMYNTLLNSFTCSSIFENSMRIRYYMQLSNNDDQISISHIFNGLLGYTVVFDEQLKLIDVDYKDTELSSKIFKGSKNFTLSDKKYSFDFIVSYYYNHDFKYFVDSQMDINNISLDEMRNFIDLFNMIRI